MEQNIEKDYVANLLEINKTMRNELEILYSLMRKKLIIEDSEIEYKKKLNDLIFKLETIQINLSSLMKNHNNLIELINDINIKVKKVENEEEKNNKINTYEKEINKINLENEEIKKKNEKLNQENIKLKEEIIENKKPLLRVKNKENNILTIDGEEPVGRIIIYNDKYELVDDIKEKRNNIIKKIILKKNLKDSLYHWYKVTIKVNNSCLNGIYGYCYSEHYTNQKYEFAPIHGNIDSDEVSDSIQPLFSDFLRNMNLSLAAFNLFTFYSQLCDNNIMIKKKYLPHWKKVFKKEKKFI